MPRKSQKVYTVDGFTGTIHEIAVHFNFPESILRQRLNNGYSIYEALHTEIRTVTRKTSEFSYKIHGVNGTLPIIAKRYEISYSKLLERVNALPVKNDRNIENIVDQMIEEKNYYEKHIDENNNYKIIESKNSHNPNIKLIDKSLSETKNNENMVNTNIYNPIVDICLNEHKDYNVVIRRIAEGNFTLHEAMTIPLTIVRTTNLVYNGKYGSMKHLCNIFNADYISVYNMVKNVYDFEYAMDCNSKKRSKIN